MSEILSIDYRPAIYDGFSVYRSVARPYWYPECLRAVGDDAHIAHYSLPPMILRELSNDMSIQDILWSLGKLTVADLAHTALHNNPSGATPLDWHSDNCQPWFHGPVHEAPRPAVRIWFFPQDTPLDRGPLELVPTGRSTDESIIVPCRAGDFIAVWDMGLMHRQTANVSGLPRFMIRLEFACQDVK